MERAALGCEDVAWAEVAAGICIAVAEMLDLSEMIDDVGDSVGIFDDVVMAEVDIDVAGTARRVKFT